MATRCATTMSALTARQASSRTRVASRPPRSWSAMAGEQDQQGQLDGLA